MQYIVTVTGPSCSGKTTFVKKLTSKYKCFKEIISHTTRPMRMSETDGKEYHFVNEQEFDSIPMCQTTNLIGYRYGASVAEFEQSQENGKTGIIIVLPESIEDIESEAKKRGWSLFKTFIDCPPVLATSRMLDRFESSMDDGITNRTATRVIYTKRLVSLLMNEQLWRYTHSWDYNIPVCDYQSLDTIINTQVNMLHLGF